MGESTLKVLTEDEVRDQAREILQLHDTEEAVAGVGQLTTFNQLGFHGVADKPDGWYLPYDKESVAVILETKASKLSLAPKYVAELKKNIRIAQGKYEKVVGILYNGIDTRVFKGSEEYKENGANELQNLAYYTTLFNIEKIDKERIYELTARINDCLHFDFGIKNLYHRMIFTACALVAKRYDALMVPGMDYSMFTNVIQSSIGKALIHYKNQNQKMELLLDVFSEIKMNLNVNSEDEKEQEHVKELIGKFIEWVAEISRCLNSDAWRGEDVMGIFFNEFNRYKKKSESGQVFTPEHITDFMYKLIDVNANDRVLDATCGSGGFLVKAMANMIYDVGGPKATKAKDIKQNHLFGIENDREIYALACANMLIHKDGKTNLEQMDARTESAADWMKEKHITKVLMNPPYERKYGCMKIVKNVLDSVPRYTLCAFILPDKKLEKVSNKLINSILAKHRLLKIVKMPEDLFFNIGVTTSIFVFQTGVPQKKEKIFGCYMESDGLEVVKNKGRHDIHHRWTEIERYWLEVAKMQSGDQTCQWIDPTERHFSYQKPQKPFEATEQDFYKASFEHTAYTQGIDMKTLYENIINIVLYSGLANIQNGEITIPIQKESNDILQSNFIDTSSWEIFRIGDIFEKLDLKIINQNFNKRIDVSETKDEEFNLPLVNAKHGNNGIMFYGRKEDFEYASMTLDIVQNGASATGDVYAQPQDTGVLWDAYLIRPLFEVTPSSLIFMAKVIERSIKSRFSYDDKCIWPKVAEISILLPAVNGSPDTSYMDSFMKNVQLQVEKNIRIYKAICE